MTLNRLCMPDSTFEQRVATLVLDTFAALPTRCKPRHYPDGSREWTPISGIVLAKDQHGPTEELKCISVATGSKCLPQNILPQCRGQVLHDCHAEILALRGLNYFLLVEALRLMRALAGAPYEAVSEYIHQNRSSSLSSHPFELKTNISIHMFSTEAPCGDASMEVLMAGKPHEDTIPWVSSDVQEELLYGRGYFGNLGVIRRKPARADAPPTMSKSCTDKLAIKQITSLLSFPTCLFLRPSPSVYLSSLILPSTRYSEPACIRAFALSGRMQKIQYATLDQSSYSYRPFGVKEVDMPDDVLPFSKPMSGKSKVCNVSALLVADPDNHGQGVIESLINGVKQGYRQKSDDPRRCSIISRFNLLQMAQEGSRYWRRLETKAVPPWDKVMVNGISYGECKGKLLASLVPERQRTKLEIGKALGGWPKNQGDEAWGVAISNGKAD